MEFFALLQLHADGIIDDEEMFLLLNQQESNSSNPVFPYWRYLSFDISIMTEDECNAEFRFKKHDIERLCIALAMLMLWKQLIDYWSQPQKPYVYCCDG